MSNGKVIDIHTKTAIDKMGTEPLNPIGQCFESAGTQVVIGGKQSNPDDVRLVHALVTANFPGQEGLIIGHAWVEGDGRALDTTWGKSFPIETYRKTLKARNIIEYTFEEAEANWKKFGHAGPWDENIKKVVNALAQLKEVVREGKSIN